MSELKIIARYQDGRMVKGTTRNFWQSNPSFHMVPVGQPADSTPEEVRLDQLKAVFVVESFNGKPDYSEDKDFARQEVRHGRRFQVTFHDGEVLVGSTLNVDTQGLGFFLFPADKQSNNQKVFVVNAAVKQVKPL